MLFRRTLLLLEKFCLRRRWTDALLSPPSLSHLIGASQPTAAAQPVARWRSQKLEARGVGQAKASSSLVGHISKHHGISPTSLSLARGVGAKVG